MSGFVKSVGNSMTAVLGMRENISIKSVRLSKLCYYMAYALELILYSARAHFLPMKTELFGIRGQVIILAFYGLSSLVVMLLWSERFKKLIWASVAVCVAGFVPFILFYDSPYRLLFGIIAYIGLGGAVTSARCGYAFAINNAERLVGMMLMFICCTIIRHVDADTANPFFWSKLFPLILLAGMCVCLLSFKESDLEVKKESDKTDAKAMYWALIYFIIYFAIDGYTWGMLDSDNRLEYRYLLAGTVITMVILFGTIMLLKLNMWHLWNIFFAFAVIMAVLAVFDMQTGKYMKQQYFFSGLSLLGWPLSIYMLACVQRRYASYKLLKKCTLIFVIASPIANFNDELIYRIMPDAYSAAALVVILICVVFLLATAPVSYKYLFNEKWLAEVSENDMQLLYEKVEETDKFEKYGLTPRQKEIATLLLAAKTRRQIAGELGVSESTVKNHTSELYKKLGINSRVELFRIFGVNETAEKE